MTRQIQCTPGNLHELIEQGARDIERRVGHILEVVAKNAVPVVRRNVPVAFGELRDSIHALPGPDPKTVVDAPHAQAVEVGSAPHTPNFAKLLAWVKLRGIQGLQGKRRIRKMAGVTTAKHAARVAQELRYLENGGNRRRRYLKNGSLNPLKVGRHSPIDAPEQVARAISRKIKKDGTEPRWFAQNSLPEIEKILRRQMRLHLKK